MESPVNLDNLRTITDGDAAMEAELFRIFLASSHERIMGLRAAGDDTAWEKEAHALKGICLNLGAGPLGALCKQAQDGCQASTDEKKKMLAAMEQEFERVRQFIETMAGDLR